jgi:hypothetical protein
LGEKTRKQINQLKKKENTMRKVTNYFLTIICALVLTVAFGSVSNAADFGYYPAVSPDLSPKVDTKAEGMRADAPLASYYPAVTPDISPKVDKVPAAVNRDYVISNYSPAVSPFSN